MTRELFYKLKGRIEDGKKNVKTVKGMKNKVHIVNISAILLLPLKSCEKSVNIYIFFLSIVLHVIFNIYIVLSTNFYKKIITYVIHSHFS